MDNLYKTALEFSPTGMLAATSEGEILMVNAEIERLFGYTRDELLGQPITLLLLDRGEKAPFSVTDFQPLGSGPARFGRKKDGQEFPIELGMRSIDHEGQQLLLVSLTDLSPHKRMNLRFQAAFESALHGLLILDDAGIIHQANSTLETMFGYEAGELQGAQVESLVPTELRNRHHEDRKAFMQSTTQRRMGAGRDLYGLRKDQTLFPVEIGLKPTEIDEGHFILATVVDITARKQMEIRLRNTQRAEAVGTLANGIAHEFNNILQGIMLATEMSLLNEPAEELANALQMILDTSERGRKLVSRILAFSRNNDLPRQPLQVSKVVSEVVELLRASLPLNITLHESHEGGSPEIISAPALLHHIVMNLATNALQAMPNGGELRISTRTELLTRKDAQRWQLSPGLYVKITVADTGSGLSPEVLRSLLHHKSNRT